MERSGLSYPGSIFAVAVGSDGKAFGSGRRRGERAAMDSGCVVDLGGVSVRLGEVGERASVALTTPAGEGLGLGCSRRADCLLAAPGGVSAAG